jgi:uncharacterized membrane protein
LSTAGKFFGKQDQELLIDAIGKAELRTSGEIRVHLENFCVGNEIKVAQKVFRRLNMHHTAERNGVLFYIATMSRKIAVIGDEGIHRKLGTEFWNSIAGDLIREFKADHKAEALAKCILQCGEQLAKYFPRKDDDKNELSNTISF